MKNKLTGKEFSIEVVIGLACICILSCLQCGCNDKLVQRAAVVEDAKSSDVFDIQDAVQNQNGNHFIVRKADGSVWVYRTSGDTDSVVSKNMVFLPTK